MKIFQKVSDLLSRHYFRTKIFKEALFCQKCRQSSCKIFEEAYFCQQELSSDSIARLDELKLGDAKQSQ